MMPHIFFIINAKGKKTYCQVTNFPLHYTILSTRVFSKICISIGKIVSVHF